LFQIGSHKIRIRGYLLLHDSCYRMRVNGKTGGFKAMSPYGLLDTFSPLRRALLRPPPANTASNVNWHAWGYPSPRDAAVARQEHEAYVALLQSHGVEVHLINQAEDHLIDCCFACDPMLMSPFGAIMLRMGKTGRRTEEQALENAVRNLDIPVLGRIKAPGTVEGGDVLWLGKNRLAVGLGFRTNREGADQLEHLLSPHGITVRRVELPWHMGPRHCLHLGSLLNLLKPDLAMVHRPLLSATFCMELEEWGFRLIDSVPEEFDTQGNNILALAPGKVLLPQGNPKTVSILEAKGVEVHTFSGNELCIKGTGGPTCLTQCLLRDH
jgi:dimethylargininase